MKPYPNAEESARENFSPNQKLDGTESNQDETSEIIDIPEIELSYNKACSKEFKGKITSSIIAADFFKEIIGQSNLQIQEHFVVLFLNRANTPVGYYRQSKGGIAGTVVDVRLILSAALKSFASALVISHNHPSGGLIPSQQDMAVTKQLQKGLKIFEITLLDHLIVSHEGYYSFSDEGKMPDEGSLSGFTTIDTGKESSYSKESKVQALIKKAKNLKF